MATDGDIETLYSVSEAGFAMSAVSAPIMNSHLQCILAKQSLWTWGANGANGTVRLEELKKGARLLSSEGGRATVAFVSIKDPVLHDIVEVKVKLFQGGEATFELIADHRLPAQREGDASQWQTFEAGQLREGMLLKAYSGPAAILQVTAKPNQDVIVVSFALKDPKACVFMDLGSDGVAVCGSRLQA
mmetsp:Transcript_42422/g.137160  ORF Transcript_42422/g.137160 Transcript_42422/m.137160 type:complete len:188 (-) Transcript_42422:125-688(-)